MPAPSPVSDPRTIAGVILAGGRSSRMGGGDKCLLPLAGRPMLAWVIERTAPQVGVLAISANGHPERFAGFGLPVLADVFPGRAGPLAGILTGLDWAASLGIARIVTVAADTPFLPLDLVFGLRAAAEAQQKPMAVAASPEEGGGLSLHPTFGLWPVERRDALRTALAGGLRRVQDWTPPEDCARAVFHDRGEPFFNVNTPPDLERARAPSPARTSLARTFEGSSRLPPILRRAGLHTTAFYASYFMATGVHLPFWPLWLRDWGLTAAQIGAFSALGIAVRVVAGLAIPAMADRLDRRRDTIAVCAIACVALFIAHLWIRDTRVLLVATLGIGVAMAGISPIAEALGVAAARVHGFPYAQARGLGSMGFLGANLLVGAAIGIYGTGIALWWIVACLTAMTVLVLQHPGGGKVEGQIPPSLREIGRVVVNPVFLIFMSAVAFTQSSHAVFYTFGSLHWRSLGLADGTIGALWAASVGAEIVFMVAIGAWTVQRIGPIAAITASGIAGMVRWTPMMFDPPIWLLVPLQSMHALTFAVGHLGAVAFIARAVPARYGAAAQGAVGSMAVGLVLSLAMLVSSAVYPALGGLTYGIGTLSSAIGLVFCYWLKRRWSGQHLAV